MTDAECAAIAEQYLSSRSIGYLRPAQVRRREPTRIEMRFPRNFVFHG
jgi:hypothetical protein